MNNNINIPQGEDQGIVKKPNVFYILAFITALIMLGMYGIGKLDVEFRDDLDQLKKSFIDSFNDEYSTTTTATYTTTTTTVPIDPNLPEGTQNALKTAYSYLKYSNFSKEGLRKQLLFEKYTEEEADYAVENCGADWKYQAVEKAKRYKRISTFTKETIIRQLEFEKFTHEEAEYAAEQLGY